MQYTFITVPIPEILFRLNVVLNNIIYMHTDLLSHLTIIILIINGLVIEIECSVYRKHSRINAHCIFYLRIVRVLNIFFNDCIYTRLHMRCR